MTSKFTRRDSLLTGLFGSGYVGLRALATGLPVWFVANPRKASAQDLQCAVTAKDKLQYLIVSTSSNGDPMNCNCPGTYEATDIIHPQQAEVAATTVTLGTKTYGAALPWGPTTAGGALDPSVFSRISFFHHMTRSTVHGDQPKVMKLLGGTSHGEMVISAFAKHLSTCFGTVQPEPIAVGARGNASELVSYSGRTLPAISPTQLKQLLTGAKNDPLVSLRSIRDTALNQLNDLAKSDATGCQAAFLDALAASQTQIRKVALDLQTVLSNITADDVKGQAYAAVALFLANVTPVVTMHIPFGGDNHTDQNLQNEADQHVSGVQGIQQVLSALKVDSTNDLTDKVTFATFNVFGRNLNGIDKVTSRSGRDHYGNHCVTVMIGKNVNPGVIGGAAPSGSSGAYSATDIDSTTGASMSGADIPAAQTHVAAAKTLGAVLGLPDSVTADDFTASAGGKVVQAAVAGG
jgi:hypothetical protein